METGLRRFSCTECGKCCNRSPEVELSEAALLADTFVFRLMFRLYWLRRQAGGTDDRVFYEKKRLLDHFAARKYPLKLRRDGKTVEYTKYLMISALALDSNPGTCSALHENRCSIYDRRPLGCRSVPFHYSRADALAESDLAAFVETPGYRCDTGATAEVVLQGGRIVAPPFKAARSEGLAMAERDRRWTNAIARRMTSDPSLPTLREIEAHARFGASTTSMRLAWQVAADVGLASAEEYCRLVQLQMQTIERELGAGRCLDEVRQTLLEMHAEYRRHALEMHEPVALSR